MKVQISGAALKIACDKFLEWIEPLVVAEADRDADWRKPEYFLWIFPVLKLLPPPQLFYLHKKITAINLRAIMIHKSPRTMYDMTAEELADIAEFLPVWVNDGNERI